MPSILCQYATKQDFNNGSELKISVSARAHAQLSNLHSTKTHFKVLNGRIN